MRGVTLEKELEDQESSGDQDEEDTGRQDKSLTCSVLLTDYGYVVKMNVDQLFPLPEELSGLRRQVFILILCCQVMRQFCVTV